MQCGIRGCPWLQRRSAAAGISMVYCTVPDKMLCGPPHASHHSYPMHSVSVLSWSFVMRTVCATHTLGSAVGGNGSIVTISLRNRLSATH